MSIFKRKQARGRQGRFRRWFRLFLVLLILGSVTVSAAVSALLVYIGTLPPIEALENYSPPQVTRVLDRTGQVVIARFKRENRALVGLNEIPDLLKKAFIAAEDERFYRHFGIDFRAVLRAIWVNLRARSFKEGFSTITMQLPRNIQEPTSEKTLTTSEKTLKRKLRDIVLALQIERRYSKEQILEFYLNQVYLGAGAYGVKAAARNYFNKNIDELTVAECALLAGLPQAPSAYSPTRHPERARRRRDNILKRMYEVDFIDREVYEKWVNEPIRLNPPPPERNQAPYFVEYLRTSLLNDPNFVQENVKRDLFGDGYLIRSTCSTETQQICDEELRAGLREVELKWLERKRMSDDPRSGEPPAVDDVRTARIIGVSSGSLTAVLGGYRGTVVLPEALPYYQPEKVLARDNLLDVRITAVDRAAGRFEAELFDTKPIQGAAVVLDTNTGELLAMSGGYDFYEAAWDGQWNRATQAERQVGSCFKPLVYAVALQNGLTPATVFKDEYTVFPNGYTPKNYERTYFGSTTLLVALEHSRNVVTVLLYRQLLGMMGARSLKDSLLEFDMVGPRSWGIEPADVTVSLGSLGMTPLELAAAYVPFANRGIGIEPIPVREIFETGRREAYEEERRKPILRFRPEERVVLSPTTAYQMIHMMHSVVLNGTGRPIKQYFDELHEKEPGIVIPKMCGKTGTTNDCTDAWFAGYSPERVVVVYVGFDSPRSLGDRMSGSYVAAPTWCRIMERVLRTRKNWKVDFDVPPEIDFADVDAESGEILAKDTVSDGRDILPRVPFPRESLPPALPIKSRFP